MTRSSMLSFPVGCRITCSRKKSSISFMSDCALCWSCDAPPVIFLDGQCSVGKLRSPVMLRVPDRSIFSISLIRSLSRVVFLVDGKVLPEPMFQSLRPILAWLLWLWKLSHYWCTGQHLHGCTFYYRSWIKYNSQYCLPHPSCRCVSVKAMHLWLLIFTRSARYGTLLWFATEHTPYMLHSKHLSICLLGLGCDVFLFGAHCSAGLRVTVWADDNLFQLFGSIFNCWREVYIICDVSVCNGT